MIDNRPQGTSRIRPASAHGRRAGALLALLLLSAVVPAGENPVPPLAGRVTDLANVLSAEDRKRIEVLLAAYEAETVHQIAVLTVPTLSGESIESFSLRVANEWGIGQKGIDDGILITVVVKDRRARIELGLGMERYITNSEAQAILEERMVPAFRRGEYCTGLQSGLEELMSEARRFRVTPEDVENARSREP